MRVDAVAATAHRSRVPSLPKRAVLFDLDGTLLDSIALILESYRHTLAAFGLPPRTDEEVLRGLGTPLEVSLGRWAATPDDVPALVDAYIEHNLAVHDRFVRPYPGISELVHRLHERGRPLAVVTSKRRVGTEAGLKALGLDSVLQVRVCADDVVHAKPHPEPVRRALAALSVDPADAVFVGDATHDIEAGRAASVATIAVTWGSGRLDDLRASSPDGIARDSAELAQQLFEG